MIIRSYNINSDLQLIPLPPENVAEECKRTDARIWLDLQDFEPDELEEWLDKLEIIKFSRRLCLEARDHSGFYPLKKEIFFVIPVLTDNKTKREIDYFAFLCRENLLLTLHSKTIMSEKRLEELDEAEDWLPERSISGLVSALMIDQSLHCLRHNTAIRESILALEDRMDRDPDSVEADEIMDLRSELLTLETAINDILPSLKSLSVIDKPFFKIVGAQEYMNSALANMLAAHDSINRLDDRISKLISSFQMYGQDKTNRRLGLLTVLSAIFMPITLLAGIWGMNFQNMPELNFSFSYPIALGLMSTIGVGLFFFFRKKGWFD